MRLGTAGLTAGLCVDALLKNGLEVGHGEVLVTGSTGGVGIIAIGILSNWAFGLLPVQVSQKRDSFCKL